MISLAQLRHGESVTYNVEPSVAIPWRAAKATALASACTATLQVSASSMVWLQCGIPDGAPLYPVEIIRLAYTNKAPTLKRLQVPASATTSAICMKWPSVSIGQSPLDLDNMLGLKALGLSLEDMQVGDVHGQLAR